MMNLKFWQNYVNDPMIAASCFGTFSQNGEDVIYSKLLANEKHKGLLVDLGAYHPVVFSNTFVLHLQGFRSVNVDASPESIGLFNALRPDDFNVQALVADETGKRTFYEFEESAFNSAAGEGVLENALAANPTNKLVSERIVSATGINELLERYVGGAKFDLLDIDVEGLDEKILCAIDFQRFRPKVIGAEIAIDRALNPAFQAFLQRVGYRMHSHCYATLILVRE